MHRCKLAIQLVSLTALASLAVAQDTQSKQPASATTSAQSETTARPKPAPSSSILEDGTPVRLRLSRTLSSADAKTGDTVDFEVLEEVKLGDALVIPKGGVAWGTVTEAEAKKRMARGGKLNVNIDSVRLVDGEKVALRAVKETKGGGHTGAMTGGMVATAIVFFPAAPFFLFMHGKDITIPKGTEITAYINGDAPLDLAKFTPNTVNSVATGNQVSAAAQAMFDVSSQPPGADVEIDGGFVGNTPSTIGVTPGDHTIKISKKGYKDWERKIKATSGSVKISAELEPISASQ